MTDTFVADQANQGTTDTGFISNADKGAPNEDGTGKEFQLQIEGMQKRMGDKDSHIKSIESENQLLREKMADVEGKLDNMSTVEEALVRMREAQNSNQATDLDEDMLVGKVLGKMEIKSKEERETTNFSEVAGKLTDLYGADKVDSIIDDAARENGLTREDVAGLARRSPKAVYRMLGIADTKSSIIPSKNTHIGFNDETTSKEQQLAYYSKLRLDNPKEYHKPEVQKKFREVCLSN